MYSSYRSLEIFSSFPRKGIQTLPEKSLYPSIERNITKFGTKTSKNCVSETTLLWQKNPKMTPFYRILDSAIKSPHPWLKLKLEYRFDKIRHSWLDWWIELILCQEGRLLLQDFWGLNETYSKFIFLRRDYYNAHLCLVITPLLFKLQRWNPFRERTDIYCFTGHCREVLNVHNE